MQIIEHPSFFQVKIEFNRFRVRNQNLIKKLEGVKFDWNSKAWLVPISHKKYLEELSKKINANWSNVNTLLPEQIGELPPMPKLNYDIDIYNRENGHKPREYQLEGIAKTIQFERCINGDEQGLGKTLQSIGAIYCADKYENKPVYPVLVVCPATTKINWKREWEMWTGKKAIILEDKIKDTWPRYYEVAGIDIFIVNFESLKKYFVAEMPKKKSYKSLDIIMKDNVNIFKSIIIDEIHRCKDPRTQTAKILLRLSRNKTYRIGLTGTLIVNKPYDALAPLSIIGAIKDGKYFVNRYCAGGTGASNLKELNYQLYKNCYFRREKKDVAKDLPDKQRQTILCDITNRDEYTKAKNDFVKWLEDNGASDEEIARKLRGEIMVRMGALKQIAAKGKMNELREFVDEVLECGEKLILFHNLHEIGDEIRSFYPNAVSINGRMSSEEKQRAIDSFQNDPNTQLIVCNIKAAGVGITLTASSRVAFIEYPWTYADCVQCEDRAHRIGQKNNVMCTYFLGQNTIDEELYKMIQEKRHVANTITGATDEMEMDFIDNVVSLFS